MIEKSTLPDVTERECQRLEAVPAGKERKCIREPIRTKRRRDFGENGQTGSPNVSIRIRKRALNVIRERHMPLIRVEPRINSSLREEFIRFLILIFIGQLKLTVSN